jgi:hypothetical protein
MCRLTYSSDSSDSNELVITPDLLALKRPPINATQARLVSRVVKKLKRTESPPFITSSFPPNYLFHLV